MITPKFTKVFSNLEGGALAETVPDGARVMLLDTPPTAGWKTFCESVVSRGGSVFIFDHHAPEGATQRDAEISALSAEIGQIIGGPNDYRKTRAEAPGCAQLIKPGVALDGNCIVFADADPDGLVAALRAVDVIWEGQERDAAFLDGGPAGKTRDNLSRVGWMIHQSWEAYGAERLQDVFEHVQTIVNRKIHNQEAKAFFKGAADLCEEMVTAACRAAAQAREIPGKPGWLLVDLVGVRADRPTLDAALGERNPLVVVSILDTGVIAQNHGGVQFSAARTKAGEAAGINLMTLRPEDVPSSPASGLISNTPFLLHMSSDMFKRIIQ